MTLKLLNAVLMQNNCCGIRDNIPINLTIDCLAYVHHNKKKINILKQAWGYFLKLFCEQNMPMVATS